MNFKTHAAVVGATTVAWTVAAIYLSPAVLTVGEIALTTSIAAVECTIAWGLFLGTKELVKAGFNRAAEKAATLDGSSLSAGATYVKESASSAYTSTSRFFGNLWNRQQQPAAANDLPEPTIETSPKPSSSRKAKKK
ncbi:hypothetical protein CC99x_007690 [Candidatus Berkiella cookevillensis]|uniref:Uncharacterized protein n=1 Tax=Candidatus Berkiella cookevillensis TaxID=437022 RepID=A0A0Q9Y9M3_9GAMM|nr:hypothetical protein [Candidatus Berkiella cookevillensis]MCS5708785.1 hypothetical protein [Candidatus Berkiella cookevillensis]